MTFLFIVICLVSKQALSRLYSLCGAPVRWGRAAAFAPKIARDDDRLTAACTIRRGRYSSLGATIFLGIPPLDPRVRTPAPLVPRTSPPGFSEPDDPSWWPKQARNTLKQPKSDNRDANAK